MTEISILKTLIDNKGYCPKAMSCRDCLIVDSVCRKASVLMHIQIHQQCLDRLSEIAAADPSSIFEELL